MYYAQPYDLHGTGFYFKTMEEYDEKYSKNVNEFGDPIEEYELQFIDGEALDAQLFKALSVSQGNIHLYLEKIEEWEDYEKTLILIAEECGYDIDLKNTEPNDFDIEIYDCDRMEELAEQFVEEGLFGDIPDNIIIYLDYEKIARDLSMDYTETRINGTNFIYRCS